MINDEKTYPQIVVVSESGSIEFPADWTLNEEHLNVVLVHDFSKVITVHSKLELDSFESLNCDWFSDITTHLVLFQNNEVFNRFKKIVPKPQAKVRVVTDYDKIEYAL